MINIDSGEPCVERQRVPEYVVFKRHRVDWLGEEVSGDSGPSFVCLVSGLCW